MASVFKRGVDKARRGSVWYCNYFDGVQKRWRTCKMNMACRGIGRGRSRRGT